MRRYWLLNQHGSDGPTALVETDGRLHIIDVLRFGPSIIELDDQQQVWDQVIGRVAPTMRPLVDANSLDEEGAAPHRKLRRTAGGAAGSASRVGRSEAGGRDGRVGRAGAGVSPNRSRGDR